MHVAVGAGAKDNLENPERPALKTDKVHVYFLAAIPDRPEEQLTHIKEIENEFKWFQGVAGASGYVFEIARDALVEERELLPEGALSGKKAVAFHFRMSRNVIEEPTEEIGIDAFCSDFQKRFPNVSIYSIFDMYVNTAPLASRVSMGPSPSYPPE